nr:uncharacterized protein LOC109154904 [Ipomoea batatas]
MGNEPYLPEPVTIEPSIPEPSTSSSQGSLPLVIQSQTPPVYVDSDSSSTMIEESSKGEDEVGWGNATVKVVPEHIQRWAYAMAPPRVAHMLISFVGRFDFQPLQMILPYSTPRIEEIQESNTKGTQVPTSEVSEEADPSHPHNESEESPKDERTDAHAESRGVEEQDIDVIMTEPLDFKKKIEDGNHVGINERDELKMQPIAQIMGETGQSFYDEVIAPELIKWWKRRIIKGKNLGEATQNYLILHVKNKYAYKIERLDVVQARREINNMLDLWDAEEEERLERKKTNKDKEKI